MPHSFFKISQSVKIFFIEFSIHLYGPWFTIKKNLEKKVGKIDTYFLTDK